MSFSRIVLVNVGKTNFPPDIAETLKPHAKVFYSFEIEYEEILAKAEVIIAGTEPINELYLRKAPNLKLISRFGVGYDSVDIASCTSRKIWITHTLGVLSGAVADHSWALLLSLMRKIPQADQYVREKWSVEKRPFTFGSDLFRKTLGIMGLGSIGTEVAKRAQGFGMELIYNDVVRKPDLESKYGIEYCEFDELLRKSDIVTLHVPLSSSTRSLIGELEFKMMKPSSVIINTSRGGVINQIALVEALELNEIAGAALDVFKEEPIPIADHLLKMENVIVTPHIASATYETRRMMAMSCAESIIGYFESKRPLNIIPEQRDLLF